MFHMKQIQQAKSELDQYVILLKKWQKAVNLIAPSTLSDIWNRHILDSAQLYSLIPPESQGLVDLGSGAGFPGLVLAILNQKNNGPLKSIYLIESDTKKCLFLKEVIRQLSLPVTVLNQRIESVFDIKADVITARALASLSQLLKLGKNFGKAGTTCLFLKGENVDQEIAECGLLPSLKKIQSITNKNSFIIEIKGVFND